MLLGEADRELLYEALKRHHAEGRIDLAELERRVAIVAEAQTREAGRRSHGRAAAALRAGARRPRSAGRAGGAVTARPRSPQPDWQPTSERFRDPRTRAVMRVWVDGAGARHYVAE